MSTPTVGSSVVLDPGIFFGSGHFLNHFREITDSGNISLDYPIIIPIIMVFIYFPVVLNYFPSGLVACETFLREMLHEVPQGTGADADAPLTPGGTSNGGSTRDQRVRTWGIFSPKEWQIYDLFIENGV